MAQSVIPPPRPPGPTSTPRPPDRFEGEIDARVRKTRRQVKLVDLASGVLSLAIGTLVYLLAGVVLDHWVVFGGLGFWGRLALFVGLVAGVVHYVVRHLVPLLVRRVNPIYAAQTLEQARPSLKNALVNYFFLRRETDRFERDPLAGKVLAGLRRSAAAELKQIPDDVAVDRIQIVRRGYLFAAVFALGALYLVLSPKSPLTSAGRILWPWAAVDAPTRVTITHVLPGDTVCYQGQSVVVSADVEGADGEPPSLVYTTEDGRIVDQEIPMNRPAGGLRFQSQLPPGKAGLQQAVRYHLAAGDNRTRWFQIQIEPALAILVDSLHYDYPDYTGLKDRTVQSGGDIRALEGTQVTIRASANRGIAWAAIEVNGDSRRRIEMAAHGKRAEGRLPLRLPGDDAGAKSEPRSYQIRFAESESGRRRENREPARHQIEVIPDLPPEVRLLDPPPETVQLSRDGSLELTVSAKDPDFALRRVALRAEVAGRQLPIDGLLERPAPEPALAEAFQSTCSFEAKRFGLKPGDKVSYWAEAVDNKEPEPNRAVTPKRWIEIVASHGEGSSPNASGAGGARRPTGRPPAGPRPSQSPRAPEAQPPPAGKKPEAKPPEQGKPGPQSEQGEEPSDGAAEDAQKGSDGPGQSDRKEGPEGSDRPQGGEAQDGPGTQQGDQASQPGAENGPGEPAESGSSDQPDGGQDAGREPLDGDTNPGDVFEEVLKQREKEMGENGSADSGQADTPSQSQPGAKPSGAESKMPGAQGPGQEQKKPSEGPSQPRDGPAQGKGQEEAPGTQPSGDSRQAPGTGGKPTGGEPPDNGPGPSQSPQDQSGTGGKPTGQPGRGAPQDAQQGEGPEGAQWKPDQGDGAQTGTPQAQRKAGPRPDDLGQQEPSAGGKPQGSPSQGGAGRQSQKPGGNPLPQGQNQQRRKQPGAPREGNSSEGGQPKSPSISPKQSDSQSRDDDSGDRSGGGGEGGGQDSDQAGTGNPGSSTASDEGGQPSGQQGEGETGPKAGNQSRAERPTGQPGPPRQGTGSGRTQPGGSQPGQPGSSDRNSAQQPPSEGSPGSGGARGHDSGSRGTPGSDGTRGGGRPDTEGNAGTATASPPTVEGSAANHEYAERATDLALEYLEEQLARQEPNQELLDRLGWTREDLERFVRKWRKMKAAAERSADAGNPSRKKLDDALESLGLTPSGTSLSGGKVRADRQLKTDARRWEPPAGWKERFRAYTEGVGRAGG